MQDYKIRIPNREISKAIQAKAYELGYRWRIDTHGRYIALESECIFLHSDGKITHMPTAQGVFDEHENPEISYQEFLHLGEISGYKVRIPRVEWGNDNNVKPIYDKLVELGYKYRSESHRSYNNAPYDSVGLYLYPDKTMTMSKRVEMFDKHEFKEVDLQLLLDGKIEEAKQQQIIMGELELKLVVSPKKAKNVTVGKSYNGILIDAEDTQVDTFEEAEYFRCENDNGKEARYSIGLFEKPVAPAPYVPSYEEIIAGIVVAESETYSTVNGVNFDLVDSGWDNLDSGDVNCSCGVKTFNGINNLMAEIESTVEGSDYSFEYPDEETLVVDLFKAIVKEAINRRTLAFAVFSTTDQDDRVINAMDSLCEADDASCFTGFKHNPNSGNNIKVWIIAK